MIWFDLIWDENIFQVTFTLVWDSVFGLVCLHATQHCISIQKILCCHIQSHHIALHHNTWQKMTWHEMSPLPKMMFASSISCTRTWSHLPLTLFLSFFLPSFLSFFLSLSISRFATTSILFVLSFYSVAFNYVSDILCKIEYDDEATLPPGTDKVLAVYNITGAYFHHLAGRQICQCVGCTVSQLVNQCVSQSVSHSACQSVTQCVGRTVSKCVSQSVSDLISRFVIQCISQSLVQKQFEKNSFQKIF